MKNMIIKLITGVLLAGTLSACNLLRAETIEPAVSETALLNMANPASVYCAENGGTLDIRTAVDGSQTGVCVFSDGSECDEWAYFRGECDPSPVVTSAPTAILEATQKAESGGGGENASGGYMAPGTTEPFENWWGVIKSVGPGAQFDDYFERQDLGGAINFGIDSFDPALQAQIVALRDSGKIVHLSGTLVINVPDYNDAQLLVDQIEIEE